MSHPLSDWLPMFVDLDFDTTLDDRADDDHEHEEHDDHDARIDALREDHDTFQRW